MTLRNSKKFVCLLLVCMLSASMLSGCTTSGKSSKKVTGLVDLTTDEITIRYAFWQDELIVKNMVKEWEKIHPNIHIELNAAAATDGFNENLQTLAASGDCPDVFWILNSCDFAIDYGLVYDMTLLWENDPEAENVISTINDYKLGYFGTQYKWTTPVKYFPSVGWANKTLFERTGNEMPRKDWTWEEYEKAVENMTFKDSDGMQVFGFHCNSANWPVTWYPVANSEVCQGEFGWDGSEYHMEDWAYGLNLQAEWKKKGYLAPDNLEECVALYGQEAWAQDIGYVAFQPDFWWCWEAYWTKDAWIDAKVYWVPYVMPHKEGIKSENCISVMDFGGISAATEHPREAYEVLKWFNWNAEGWNARLDHYEDTVKEDGERFEMNHMPITLDKTVWDRFKETCPGDDDELGRGEWFEYFFEHCKRGLPLGGTQIPGFDTWLADKYNGSVMVEDQVMNQGANALDFVEELESSGKEYNRERLQTIESSFITN